MALSPTLDNTLLAMVVVSCIFHAAWNLASRHWRNFPGFVWGVVVWSGIWALLTLPWSGVALVWNERVLLCALITGIGLGIYYICLRSAYRLGEVTLVYPLIRSAPLWVSLVSFFYFGERFSAWAWVGVAFTIVGVFVLPLNGFRKSDLARFREGLFAPATLLALGASLGTTLYTLSDKAAMVAATGWEAGAAFRAVTVPIGLLLWRLGEGSKACQGFRWKRLSAAGVHTAVTAASGFCLFAAFSLVVAALIEGGAGRVLAITNLGVVLGSVGAIILFRERQALGPRLAGLAMTVGGVILLRFH